MNIFKLTTSIYEDKFFSSYEKAEKTAYLLGLLVTDKIMNNTHCTITKINVE